MNYVLIPSHNNASLLQNCIKSVLAQTVDDVRIFAVNNGSTDNTPQILNSLDRTRHIVNHHYPQLGVAGAWNKGLSYLFDVIKAPHVLVINEDTWLPPYLYRDLISIGREFVTAYAVGGLASSIPHYIKYPIRESENPDFSCFLIRKSAWDLVGPFDEMYYPAFGEDCDYHVRMHRAGIKAWKTNVPFYHAGSATIKNASPEERKYIQQCADKNRQYFFETYGAHIGIPEEYDRLFE